MPRKLRNKSSNSKSNNMNENLILVEERPIDLNGTTSLEDINRPHCSLANEISKKRTADDANESNSDDLGPPNKKRNTQDHKNINTKTLKRSIEISDDDCNVKKTKLAKLENIDGEKMNFIKRIWKDSNSLDNCNGQNCSTNLPHFVIATYNILLDENMQFVKTSTKSNDKSKHNRLMQEIDFINADILCLQQVSFSYWKDLLESSLKERGFCGDIVIEDRNCDVGVATLYRISRFVKVNIDSNKLSKLCVEHIPLNCDLDETTLNSIKQYLDEPDSYIVTVLKDKQIKDERLLIVGNTHLSCPSVEKLDLRCVQAVSMFWRIHEMISQIKSDLINNNNGNLISPSWILCGDFNSNCESPVYQICRDGYPNEHSIKQLQSVRKVPIANSHESSSLVDLLWHSFQHPLTDSCSSYLKVMSYEPSKDYIWMSEGRLLPNKVLMPCSSEYYTSNAVTTNNNRLPLDHMSLACDVAFTT